VYLVSALRSLPSILDFPVPALNSKHPALNTRLDVFGVDEFEFVEKVPGGEAAKDGPTRRIKQVPRMPREDLLPGSRGDDQLVEEVMVFDNRQPQSLEKGG
jgi:hypothetical protein